MLALNHLTLSWRGSKTINFSNDVVKPLNIRSTHLNISFFLSSYVTLILALLLLLWLCITI